MKSETLNALVAVNVQYIQREQNIDFLQALVNGLERTIMTPMWYSNADGESKLKVLKLYQISLNYAKNTTIAAKSQLAADVTRLNALRMRNEEMRTKLAAQKKKIDQNKIKYKRTKLKIQAKKRDNALLQYQMMLQKQSNEKEQLMQQRFFQMQTMYFAQLQTNNKNKIKSKKTFSQESQASAMQEQSKIISKESSKVINKIKKELSDKKKKKKQINEEIKIIAKQQKKENKKQQKQKQKQKIIANNNQHHSLSSSLKKQTQQSVTELKTISSDLSSVPRIVSNTSISTLSKIGPLSQDVSIRNIRLKDQSKHQVKKISPQKEDSGRLQMQDSSNNSLKASILNSNWLQNPPKAYQLPSLKVADKNNRLVENQVSQISTQIRSSIHSHNTNQPPSHKLPLRIPGKKKNDRGEQNSSNKKLTDLPIIPEKTLFIQPVQQKDKQQIIKADSKIKKNNQFNLNQQKNNYLKPKQQKLNQSTNMLESLTINIYSNKPQKRKQKEIENENVNKNGIKMQSSQNKQQVIKSDEDYKDEFDCNEFDLMNSNANNNQFNLSGTFLLNSNSKKANQKEIKSDLKDSKSQDVSHNKIPQVIKPKSNIPIININAPLPQRYNLRSLKDEQFQLLTLQKSDIDIFGEQFQMPQMSCIAKRPKSIISQAKSHIKTSAIKKKIAELPTQIKQTSQIASEDSAISSSQYKKQGILFLGSTLLKEKVRIYKDKQNATDKQKQVKQKNKKLQQQQNSNKLQKPKKQSEYFANYQVVESLRFQKQLISDRLNTVQANQKEQTLEKIQKYIQQSIEQLSLNSSKKFGEKIQYQKNIHQLLKQHENLKSKNIVYQKNLQSDNLRKLFMENFAKQKNKFKKIDDLKQYYENKINELVQKPKLKKKISFIKQNESNELEYSISFAPDSDNNVKKSITNNQLIKNKSIKQQIKNEGPKSAVQKKLQKIQQQLPQLNIRKKSTTPSSLVKKLEEGHHYDIEDDLTNTIQKNMNYFAKSKANDILTDSF